MSNHTISQKNSTQKLQRDVNCILHDVLHVYSNNNEEYDEVDSLNHLNVDEVLGFGSHSNIVHSSKKRSAIKETFSETTHSSSNNQKVERYSRQKYAYAHTNFFENQKNRKTKVLGFSLIEKVTTTTSELLKQLRW